MPPRKLIGFFGRFALYFSLGFVAPWLGLTEPCGVYFRTLGTAAFSSRTGPREIEFERLNHRETRIVIVNRALMNADGSGPVRNLDIRPRNFIWWPLCFYLALVLAGPRSPRHRVWPLVCGVLAMQGLMLLVLGFAIWNNSTEVALVKLSPAWKSAAEATQASLESFLSLGAPVLLWVLFAFRRADFVRDPSAPAAHHDS